MKNIIFGQSKNKVKIFLINKKHINFIVCNLNKN